MSRLNMVSLFLAMTIATIIVCFLVTDTIEQFSRRRIVNTILEDFEGDFIVSRIAGKFDGLRISGTILDDAEFSRLADRLTETNLPCPVDLNLNCNSQLLSQTISNQHP